MVSNFSVLQGNPVFVRFWLSRIFSTLGATFTRLAIPLEMLKSTGSPSLAALATTVSLAPILVLGIPAGAIADRSSRVRIMRAAELGSMIATLGLAIVFFTFGYVTAPVLVVVFALAVLAIFFDACSFGLLPSIVSMKYLGQANGLLYGNNTTIALIGPVLAGLLYSWLGIAFVLVLNAFTFALSAILLFTVPRDLGGGEPFGAKLRAMPSDMMQGIAVIWRSAVLRYLVGAGAATGISGGALSACIVIVASSRFHGGAELAGLFVSMLGLGAFLGSVALSFATERLSQTRVTLILLPIALVAFVGAAVANTPVLMSVFCILWGMTYTMLIINNVTIRQSILPGEYQARVNSTARTIAWGGEPVGAGLAVLLLSHFSDMIVLILAGVPFAIMAALAPFTPLRQRELAPIVVAPDASEKVSR